MLVFQVVDRVAGVGAGGNSRHPGSNPGRSTPGVGLVGTPCPPAPAPMAPSVSGLGRRPFKADAGVRIPSALQRGRPAAPVET